VSLFDFCFLGEDTRVAGVHEVVFAVLRDDKMGGFSWGDHVPVGYDTHLSIFPQHTYAFYFSTLLAGAQLTRTSNTYPPVDSCAPPSTPKSKSPKQPTRTSHRKRKSESSH
jgi:hypothetical protein